MKKPRVNTADKQNEPREAPAAHDPSFSKNGTTILRNETLFQVLKTESLTHEELDALMNEVFNRVLPKIEGGSGSVSGSFGTFYSTKKN